jgi:hypothetical protein
MKRPPTVYQLAFDADGKLLGFATTKSVLTVRRFGCGTAVYCKREIPAFACPPRKGDCHPQDVAPCMANGFYQKGTQP